MAEEFVKMTHPGIDGVAGPVTRRAFDEIWAPKGWVLAPDDQQPAAEPQPPEQQGAQ